MSARTSSETHTELAEDHQNNPGDAPPRDEEKARQEQPHKVRDPNLVTFSEGDPENPRNWSTKYKSWITFQLGMLALSASLGSSIIAPAGKHFLGLSFKTGLTLSQLHSWAQESFPRDSPVTDTFIRSSHFGVHWRQQRGDCTVDLFIHVSVHLVCTMSYAYETAWASPLVHCVGRPSLRSGEGDGVCFQQSFVWASFPSARRQARTPSPSSLHGSLVVSLDQLRSQMLVLPWEISGIPRLVGLLLLSMLWQL